MNDLVMLSVLGALFMFFGMCFLVVRFIGTWLEKNCYLNSKVDVMMLLSFQIFSVICLMLALWNVIDYTF